MLESIKNTVINKFSQRDKLRLRQRQKGSSPITLLGGEADAQLSHREQLRQYNEVSFEEKNAIWKKFVGSHRADFTHQAVEIYTERPHPETDMPNIRTKIGTKTIVVLGICINTFDFTHPDFHLNGDIRMSIATKTIKEYTNGKPKTEEITFPNDNYNQYASYIDKPYEKVKDPKKDRDKTVSVWVGNGIIGTDGFEVGKQVWMTPQEAYDYRKSQSGNAKENNKFIESLSCSERDKLRELLGKS